MSESEIATLREFARTAEGNMHELKDAVRDIQKTLMAIMMDSQTTKAETSEIKKTLHETKTTLDTLTRDNGDRDERLKQLEVSSRLNWKWIVAVSAFLGAVLQTVGGFVAAHLNIAGK